MKPHVLATAFAPTPGASPDSVALLSLADGVRGVFDLVTLKTEALSHSETRGETRIFRVPVGADQSAAEQRAHFARAVQRQIASEMYEVVHVRGAFEGAEVAKQKDRYGFRFVYEVGAYPDEAEGPEAEKAWTKAHALCVREASGVIVPSYAAGRALTDMAPDARVTVIPSGVDLNAFDWLPTESESLKRIIYLGSFSADRDLETFLGAMKRLQKRGQIQALLVGDAIRERRQRLRRIVEAMDLGSIVQVRGEPRFETIPSILASADLALVSAAAVPRFQELGDLPQPILEPMACRRPVIAAGVPAVAEVIRDERDGLLYMPGDEVSLADAVSQVLADEGLQQRLAASAYERVRESFSLGQRRRRLLEFYETLCPGSQGFDPWNEAFDREVSRLVPAVGKEDESTVVDETVED